MSYIKRNASILTSTIGILLFVAGMLMIDISVPAMLASIGAVLLVFGFLRLQIREITILERAAKNSVRDRASLASLFSSVTDIGSKNLQFLEDADRRTRMLLQISKKSRGDSAKLMAFSSVTSGLVGDLDRRTRRILEEASRKDFRAKITKTEQSVQVLVDRETANEREVILVREASTRLNNQLGLGFSKLAKEYAGLSARVQKIESDSALAEAGRWQASHRALLGGLHILPSLAGSEGYLKRIAELSSLRAQLSLVIAGDIVVTHFTESSVYAIDSFLHSDCQFILICRSLDEQVIARNLFASIGLSHSISPILYNDLSVKTNEEGFEMNESSESDLEEYGYFVFSKKTDSDFL